MTERLWSNETKLAEKINRLEIKEKERNKCGIRGVLVLLA